MILDDGTELKYTTNALITIENHFKEPIQKFFKRMSDEDLGLTEIRFLFWAGLVKKVKLEEAGRIIDKIGITKVAEYISEALQEAFGTSKGGEEKN